MNRGLCKTQNQNWKIFGKLRASTRTRSSDRLLNTLAVHGQTFATRVCRNCEVRFSCSSYREYAQTSQARDLPRSRDIYEDTSTEADREGRMNAGLEATQA